MKLKTNTSKTNNGRGLLDLGRFSQIDRALDRLDPDSRAALLILVESVTGPSGDEGRLDADARDYMLARLNQSEMSSTAFSEILDCWPDSYCSQPAA